MQNGIKKKILYSTAVFSVLCTFSFCANAQKMEGTTTEYYFEETTTESVGIEIPLEEQSMLLGIGEEETTTATSISLILTTEIYPFIFLVFIILFLWGLFLVKTI